MALSQDELNQERLQQLRRLAQSPGWADYRQAVMEALQRSHEEKASALRKADVSQAFLAQGRSDGLTMALATLDKLMDVVSSTEMDTPLY